MGRNFLPKQESTLVLLKKVPLRTQQSLLQEERDFPVEVDGLLGPALESENIMITKYLTLLYITEMT